jgi:hypothetical protein
MKMKTRGWSELSKMEKLAASIYPSLSGPIQAEMVRVAAISRERPPQSANLLPHAKRGATSPLGGKVW